MNQNIVDRIVKLFAEQLQIDVPDYTVDLIDAGLLDSLVFVDLIVCLEIEFDESIDITAIELDEFRSVQQIADTMERLTEATETMNV